MAHHHELDCLAKDWTALLWSRSRSQKKFKIPVTVHQDDISLTAETFVTILGMTMHHYWLECHARRLVCCLQVESHIEGSNN